MGFKEGMSAAARKAMLFGTMGAATFGGENKAGANEVDDRMAQFRGRQTAETTDTSSEESQEEIQLDYTPELNVNGITYDQDMFGNLIPADLDAYSFQIIEPGQAFYMYTDNQYVRIDTSEDNGLLVIPEGMEYGFREAITERNYPEYWVAPAHITEGPPQDMTDQFTNTDPVASL